MLKDEIIQRSTLRGLKKCKSCGNYNGNRARGCINKNCPLHIIKKLQKKTKYNSIDPIQLITYNDTKIYSVRNKEREPLYRNFVQITDTILSSDKNGSIISRNAICYVDTCKYDSNDIKNLSCKHVKSVTTECKLYAQEIKISKNILYNMKIDNKLKINLWNLYNDNNELFIPSIQRINKTTFVIKCIKNIKFPAGRLHITVKSDDDHNDNDFYYICACKKLKILLSQNNNSTVILENYACDHLLMLLAGILSSPQNLQNQFQNLIKSLKIFWDNNNDCNFTSIPSATTLDTNDFLQNGDLYNFTEGILNSVTELDNNESLPVNLFQNNDDNSNQLLHQLISNEYDNKIINENNEIHLLEMPSSKLIKNFYPIDMTTTTTTTATATTENIIDGSNNNNIIENNDNNNSNLLSISTVMETESPSSSSSSSSSLTLPLTLPPSLLPLSLPSPSIIDNEYLELADCQIELMDQFKLTDQIDLCNSEVLLNIDEYMEMEKNDNNINNYNSILNNNKLNLNLEHNNNQNDIKMINIDTNNCYNNDSMNDNDKTIISDNQMKYRKLNKKYNKQHYKTATAGTPVTTTATATTTTTRILETAPILGISTVPTTTAATIKKSSSINHCNKSLITQKNNITSRQQQPIFEFNEWLEFVIEKINMSIDANSKNTNIKHAFSIKNEFFEYFSQKFSINGKRRIPNDTVIIKNGKFKGLIQSKWTFYSPSIIKRIFTTQTSQIEFEKYFIQESNGTYKLYDEIMNPNDDVLDKKFLNNKKYKKILPNLLCTFIKIDLNLEEENRNAFSIEWIPDVFPKSQIGIMRIEFSIDFRKNKSL